MGKFDLQYNQLVNDIITNGTWDKDQAVRTKWSNGTPAYTKSLISKQIAIDTSEVPILTTKRVAWKSAIHELIWFYIKRTSDVSYLRENNVKIWEDWTRNDGTIGKAYGYQLGKPIRTGIKENFVAGDDYLFNWSNQVEKLIDGLKYNPASRRHIITLMNIDDAWDMALQSCVWHNQWLVKENKLHLIVGIRSNDIGLGNPFNIFQYYVLQRMVAQVTGYELGTLTFNINDAHVYERHIKPLQEQIQRDPYPAPKLWINQGVKEGSFDDYTIDDFILVDPKFSDFEIQEMSREEALENTWYEHHDKIEMEVAI